MPFIALLGCDGCGKSAVLGEVARQLAQQGVAVARGHWRPKAFGEESGDGMAAADPHGQPPRGTIASLAKLGWLWLNWRVAWARELRGTARHGVLLFDRYHADLLVDPRRYRYGGPRTAAVLACRLMPQPDRVIFLDAPPAVLLSRKQEVDEATLERSRKAYLDWCRTEPRACIVDASRPLDEVVATVMGLVQPVRPALLAGESPTRI